MNLNPLLPNPPANASPYERQLNAQLTALFRQVAKELNAVANGSLQGTPNAATAAPATGTWADGDFVRKSNPTEQGAPGSKYVLAGWLRVAGAWKECRYLTGN